jgi:predicted component of type VI protein secretion system
VETASAAPDPASRTTPHGTTRGERLVALSALAVLAIAAVFFVERIGGLRSAPPPLAPALELASPPMNDASPVPPVPAAVPLAPTSEATRPAKAARLASRPPFTPVATTRKPERVAQATRALPEPATAPIVVASIDPRDIADNTRWQHMRDEVAACAGQGHLFDAVLCDQRVRLRYCDDWWGRASECPSGRQADYGN